ncbi:MAG: transposase [Chlorobiaceae bacterium]|nr:transposase [Chlorobiaceae bacterium]
MAYREHQLNKKTGVAYVKEAVSVWNKELRQSRNKQVCVGKIDPVTGEFIPSKRLDPAQAALRDPAMKATAEVIGPTCVLDTIARRIGLSAVMESAFPDTHQDLLTIAFFLTSQGGPLRQCSSWAKSHAPHLSPSLSNQCIRALLSSIRTDNIKTFFARWVKQHPENNYFCHELSSALSYQKLNDYFRFGSSHDGEKTPQLNLIILFGQNSDLPVWYHQAPGKCDTVSSLHKLVQPFRALESGKLHYVLNPGFFSNSNIDDLVSHRDHFTIPVSLSNTWVQQAIDEVKQRIQGPEGYRKLNDDFLYVHSRTCSWGASKRRCTLHLYYNANNQASAVDAFNESLDQYRQEIESGNPVAEHQKAYEEFLIVKTTSVSFNTEAINHHSIRYAGFQALLSCGINDPVEAMRIYRDKETAETCFDDLNNSLDETRLEINTASPGAGRLFVQFIAQILISALRRQMHNTSLIAQYSVQELLMEMETLTKVHYAGKDDHILTELTEPQQAVLKALDIQLP